MTMAQGGLFNGDEEAYELPTTDLHGQSQTRKAKYHRAYRSDPKNKDRINSQKKRRRALKKEREMGNVSSMFESAARPSKEEQQTIENELSTSDNASLSNQRSETSCKSEATAELINVLQQGFAKLDRNFDNLQSELAYFKENPKPTAPALPKVNNTEQQASVSGIAITNGANVSKKKTIAKLIVEKLPTFGMSLLILTFLAFNTYFLVSEQQSLYESMSYSAGMALLIAVLSEASLIMLSAMVSWTPSLEWKIGLTTGMLAMVMVMVGILDSSAESRVNTAARQSQEAKNIEKQLVTLRALETPILARIEKLDPQHYRTEIDRLSKSLTAPPNGYTYKIEQLSSKLATISTSHADISKMVWQRRVSLLLNLLFSSFLGFLWARNKEGFLTKISKSLGGVLNRPCEV